jgi:two-component system LytT family response regulator
MNSPLKALIIEDEPLATKRLMSLLEKHKNEIDIIACASNGEEGLSLINKHKPEVIFLDIQMPVMNGLEMLSKLENQPKIIFTTAYDEYALRSFEENSIDYLLKPIRAERLEKAINKLLQLSYSDTSNSISIEQLQNLMGQLNQQPSTNALRVTLGDRIVIVKLEHIQYLLAEDKLTKVVDIEGKSHFINPSLKQLLPKLPNNFIQVSRSCILNEDFVKEIRKSFNRKLVFEMQDKKKITVGSSFVNALKERWSL